MDKNHELGQRKSMTCDLETSVPDWVIDHPESTAVFNELGIDASCAGKSLEYVCRQQVTPSPKLEPL